MGSVPSLYMHVCVGVCPYLGQVDKESYSVPELLLYHMPNPSSDEDQIVRMWCLDLPRPLPAHLIIN